MKEVILPFVPGEAGLTEALTRLQEAGKSALVTEAGHRRVLLTVADLAERSNHLVATGRSPEHVAVARVVPRADPVELQAALTGPFAGPGRQGQIKRVLEATPDRRYGVVSVTGDQAVVAAASAKYADTLATSTLLCRCKGPPRHLVRASELAGGRCKLHDAEVSCDGGRW